MKVIRPVQRTSMLGLKWNNVRDTLTVDFLECQTTTELSKKGMLRAMVKVYDPLGFASPIMLEAKHLFPKICEAKSS